MHREAALGTHRRDVLVLCYHAVSDTWPELISIEPARLEAQVARLLRAGWRPTTFTDAAVAPHAPKTLAVTFDDGFRSVYRLAAPILRRLGVPATIFVPTGFVDSGRPGAWPHLDKWVGTRYEAELTMATWRELVQLHDLGWEIGSHTVSHPHLSELTAEAVDAELRQSKNEIEGRIGDRCRSIAYPYGDVDRGIARRAEECGFEAGAAVLPIRHHNDRLRFPRVLISSQESEWLHRLHLRRAVRRMQSTAAWPFVQDALGRVAGERSPAV